MAVVGDQFQDVTVVIKTLIRYGVARRTIRSFRLTLPDVRIVVIDDTPEKWRQDLDGVDHIVTDPDIGLCAGRNLGFRLSETDIVAYTDDDAPCHMSLEDWQEAVGYLRRGETQFLGSKGARFIHKKGEQPHLQKVSMREISEADGLLKVGATQNAFLASRSLLLKHPYDDRIKINGEHFSYFLHLADAGVDVHTAACVKFRNLNARGNKHYRRFRNRNKFRKFARETTGFGYAKRSLPPGGEA